ncbi:unnamed protein product [Sphagnum balticum]
MSGNGLSRARRASSLALRTLALRSLFPSAGALLFGSNAIGLSLPNSDVDIMLLNLPCSSREEVTEVLAQIAVEINAMAWVVSCGTYLAAKVPIVKL